MRRYERASTLLTSNRPVEDWGNCSATALRLPPCSTAFFTTGIFSNAGHRVGEQKSTSRNNGRFQRCSTSLVVPWATGRNNQLNLVIATKLRKVVVLTV
jgi:hypothetical protein